MKIALQSFIITLYKQITNKFVVVLVLLISYKILDSLFYITALVLLYFITALVVYGNQT
jgi:hypothetical protein